MQCWIASSRCLHTLVAGWPLLLAVGPLVTGDLAGDMVSRGRELSMRVTPAAPADCCAPPCETFEADRLLVEWTGGILVDWTLKHEETAKSWAGHGPVWPQLSSAPERGYG